MSNEEVKLITNIFVYYKPLEAFNLDDMNIPWNWISSEITHNNQYPYEMHFTGSNERYHEMYHYLYNQFDKLKNEGIVERYHISENYMKIKNL